MITEPPAYNSAALGIAIAKARRAAKLTHEQLAARSGVSRRHLIDLEAGRKAPTARTLHSIAHALDVNGGDLFMEGCSH